MNSPAAKKTVVVIVASIRGLTDAGQGPVLPVERTPAAKTFSVLCS